MSNPSDSPERLTQSDDEPPPPSPTPLDDASGDQSKQLDVATQARLEALLEAAGIVSNTQEARRALADPGILRRLTTSVSSALDEATATLSRIRAESDARGPPTRTSLAEACANGNYAAVSQYLNDKRGLQDLTQEESESLLSLACSAGYFELAQVLVSMRTAKEGEGALKHDSTPLMEAASGGYVDIVKLLNAHGAEVNAQSEAGNTALTYAACGGYEDVIQVLLEAGATIEEQNESGHTALMEAASAGHISVARLLLTKGANINMHSNEFKESALTLAAYKGHAEMVEFLLENGADMDHKTDEMHNALMEACMDGHVEVARVLLDHDASVNMPADSFESPLTLAACGGHVELAALLISRGANLEEVNDEGYTPLMEAAREGNDVVQLLVENGATVNAITEETQETALTLACCGGLLDVSRYLLDHNADIELGASTPLMEAAQEGHADLVKFLIEKGANVDATTATNDTALTFACANGHTDVTEILLNAGAELEHKSEGGRTPLMKAARAGHLTTVEFLVSKGASVNMKTTNNDHTVLSLASAGGHLPIVMLLLQHGADPAHVLKDSSTMLIETSKGGHVHVAALLLEQGYSDSRVLPPAAKGTDVKELPGISGGSIKGKQKKKHKAAPPPQPDSKGKQEKASASSEMLPQEDDEADPRDTLCPCPVHNPQHEGVHDPTSACDTSSVTTASFTPLHMLPSPDTDLSESQSVIPPFKYHEQHYQHDATISPSRTPSAFTGSTALIPNNQLLTTCHPQTHTSVCPLSPPFTTEMDREFPVSSSTQSPKRRVTSISPLAMDVSSQPTSLNDGTGNEVSTRNVTERRSPEGSSGFSEPVQVSSASPPPSLSPQSRSMDSIPVKPFTFTGTRPVAAASTASEEERFCFDPESVIDPLAKFSSTTDSLTAAILKNPGLVHDFIKDHRGLHEFFQKSQTGDAPSLVTLPPVVAAAAVNVLDEAVMDSVDEIKERLYRDMVPVHDIRSDALHVPPSSPTSLLPPMLHNLPQDEDMMPASAACMHGALGYEDDGMLCEQLMRTPMRNLAPHVPAIDVDMQTESNHDTALTLAASGGHDELVELLLERGADLEHKDKKGCSPLILASTAGHASTSEILLHHYADIEAQSDRTKDTALSLACSGGRQEVVELLLNHGANFEHRNMSDYTPLSLAASGGYVGIIKTLLQHGAEINSRTGSKLGISPLMLAAMNGHTAAVKLLLDMGSDINAQIETNRNTALTLACFQGRHEVVSLLVDRKANVEHRAKTGLTPLMEAASGGYVEVGKVLLERGADVNAPPVPSSKDTALTIAADKGHSKFVELVLEYGALVDVRNKKGASPLWLACNGGHWEVVQHLISSGADPDAEDNRGVSCLVAAFRRGHVKVVKYMVKKVSQFPNDADGTRFISTVSDKDLLKRCKQSMEIILTAKDRQAAEANKHATILLQELDQERTREENRRAAAAKKRSKRRRQKQKKKEEKEERDQLRMQPRTAPDGSESETDKQPGQSSETSDTVNEGDISLSKGLSPSKPTTTIQLDIQTPPPPSTIPVTITQSSSTRQPTSPEPETLTVRKSVTDGMEKEATVPTNRQSNKPKGTSTGNQKRGSRTTQQLKSTSQSTSSKSPSRTTGNTSPQRAVVMAMQSPRRGGKRSEEGWKEVVRKVKRIPVPGHVVSRVMGRSGTNIVAIRQASGAHVDVERGRAGQDRMVTIRGNTDAIRIASNVLMALMKEPECDVSELLPGKQSQGGVRRGSGGSGTGGVSKVHQSQVVQQAVGVKSHPVAKPGQPAQTQTSRQTGVSQISAIITQPPNAPILNRPPIQPPTTQPISTPQASSSPQPSQGVKRQLFSAAAAPKPSTQSRAASLTGPPTTHLTNDQLQKYSRSVSVPTTMTSTYPNLVVSSLFSQVAQTRSPSVWSTASSQKGQQKNTIPEDTQLPVTTLGPIGSSPPTAAVSSTQAVNTITPPLSHFEPLITQTPSASSSKAPSPVPSPRPSSPRVASPGAVGQRETRTIAPIGTERAHETNQEKQEKQKSPSPSGSDKQEERQTPAPIGTGRSRQQPSQKIKTLDDGGSIKPIGTERTHRQSGNVPTAIVNPGFPTSREQPSLNPQPTTGVWAYPTTRRDVADWSMQPTAVASMSTSHPVLSQYVSTSYSNSTRGRSLESLASLLDRLSLSKHLNLFQRNEIDLDALMLMSEKDYAEIGLPKGPRMKLLNATGRLDETCPPDQYPSQLQSPVSVTYSRPTEDSIPVSQHHVLFPATGMPSTIAAAASRAWASVPPVQTTSSMSGESALEGNATQQAQGQQQPSGDGAGKVGWKSWS